jgi:hypothetical protein
MLRKGMRILLGNMPNEHRKRVEKSRKKAEKICTMILRFVGIES